MGMLSIQKIDFFMALWEKNEGEDTHLKGIKFC